MRILGSLLAALLLAAAPVPARGQTIHVVPEGGTAGDFKQQDLSKAGDKGPFGATRLKGVDLSITGQGPSAVITVTLHLEFTINSARLGEQYTVKEQGPCRGLTFAMTEPFIKSHELEHVEQLQEVVRERVRQVLRTEKPGTWVDASGHKVPTWTYNASAPNPGQVGQTGDPAWQADFTANIQSWVNRFLAQEAAEYAHVEKHGQFPSGGTFPGIEKRAREKSCEDFMVGVGSQIVRAQGVLTQAQQDGAAAHKASGRAASEAKSASDAAAAALAAAGANPCNMEQFHRAVERYTAAAGKATDHVEEAEHGLEAAKGHATEIDALSTQYDQAKREAHVTAFPGEDREQRDVQQAKATLEASTAKTEAALHQVGATLAAASATLKEAYEKIKACDKSQDPRWKPLLDSLARAYDATPAPEPPPAAAPPSPPSATPPAPSAPTPPGPGAPTQDTLRSVIGSLESERPFEGPAYVPPPASQPSPVPPVPQIPQPPPRRLDLPPAGEPLTEQQIDDLRRAEREERERQARIERQQRIHDQEDRARGLTVEAPQPAVPYVPGSLGESTFANDQAVARLGSLLQQQPGAPPAPAPAAWTFVPGQIVVGLRLAPPAALAPIVADLERRIGLRRLDTAPLTSINTQLVLFEVTGRQTVRGAAAVAAADPRVLFAQPNFLSVTAADHRDTLAGLQYGPVMMEVPRAHDRVTGKAVRVAVIDTGVDGRHPDLVGRIGRRANFAEGDDAAEIHGTAVAGIVAATAGNNVGIYGVAPEAELLALRACHPRAPERAEGVCAAYALARAVDFAIVNGARVINLSVAGPRDALMPRLMARAWERGVVVVAAVGNLGPKAPPPYPAAIETVIAVTAVDAHAAIYPAAVQGRFVSVAAPGVEIVTTFPGGRYATHTGTSMAAAHVSGVVALLLQARPELSPAAVRGLLEDTARAGRDGRSLQLGHGLVNGCRAVDRTLGARLGC